MMWALAIKSKLTAAILLCAVLGVVMVINFGTRNNSKKINLAVASIYEDRLVVEGYIFEYAKALRRVEQINNDPTLTTAERHSKTSAVIDAVQKLNVLYAKTRLTKAESNSFKRFTSLCHRIKDASAKADTAALKAGIAQAGVLPNTLSSIQISEAKTQLESVTKLNSFADLLSQLELIIVIIIAVVIQVLVFSSAIPRKVAMPTNIHLN